LKKHDLARLLADQGPVLHALLWRLTLRHDAADDLLQELFLKLYDSGGFHGSSNPPAYLRRAAINLALDWRRSVRRQPVGTLDPQFDGTDRGRSPVDVLADAESLERILNAAAELGELSREAFVMRYVQQDSFEAIAGALSRTPHQARALCHHAVRQVRQRLNPTSGPVPSVPEVEHE
jgi:RNA polymerase sigma-70 factor (ECF subfamily)